MPARYVCPLCPTCGYGNTVTLRASEVDALHSGERVSNALSLWDKRIKDFAATGECLDGQHLGG